MRLLMVKIPIFQEGVTWKSLCKLSPLALPTGADLGNFPRGEGEILSSVLKNDLKKSWGSKGRGETLMNGKHNFKLFICQ